MIYLKSRLVVLWRAMKVHFTMMSGKVVADSLVRI